MLPEKLLPIKVILVYSEKPLPIKVILVYPEKPLPIKVILVYPEKNTFSNDSSGSYFCSPKEIGFHIYSSEKYSGCSSV